MKIRSITDKVEKMDKQKQILIICSISIVILIIMGAIGFKYISDQEDKACKKLGFEEYKFNVGMKYCRDKSGNLHYVEHECDFFMTDCQAKLISVGNVRTITRG